MTQNEKDLLLKDLCARLPYGVKVYDIKSSVNSSFMNLNHVNGAVKEVFISYMHKCRIAPIEDVKPYLFPLSSMTEEQYYEMENICNEDCLEYIGTLKEWRKNSSFSHLPFYEYRVIDWLNKNHFDYRGLIEKELAIDATGLNIY